MDHIPVIVGAEYKYTAPFPKGCKGHLYRVERFVLDVPNYQQKVLMQALTGKDGDNQLWFVCSLANFSTRYALVRRPEVAAANDYV